MLPVRPTYLTIVADLYVVPFRRCGLEGGFSNDVNFKYDDEKIYEE